jgi:hypothetical protein
MSQGDIETATIFTRAMRKIQGKISSILAGGANANFTAMPQVGGSPLVGPATTTKSGTVEKATTTEAKEGTANKFPDAAGVNAAFNQYGLGVSQLDAGILLDDTDDFDYTSFAMGAVYYWDTLTPLNGPTDIDSFGEFIPIVSNGGNRTDHLWNRRTSKVWFRSWTDNSPNPWFEVFNQASILGSVSQSAGVPTGAIIEKGSNSNGEYTKFADGTMICWISKPANSATSFGSGTAADPYRSSVADYTFPVAFVTDAPVVSSSAYRNVSSTGRIAYAAFEDVTLTGITQAQAITVTNDVAPTLNFIAFGRWF